MVDASEKDALGIDVYRLRDAIDHLREGIQVLTPDWRYLYLNDAAARHGRKSRVELLGSTLLECYPGIEHTEGFAALDRCMRERRAETFENEFRYPEGGTAWFEIRVQPCPEGVVVLSLDITERKQLETTLRQSEKIRALGQVAAGVAHDLRNIFNPISLDLRALRRRCPEEPELQRVLRRLQDAVGTGTDTVERLRRFSRQESEQDLEPIDLNRVTEAALAICMPHVHEHGRIQLLRRFAEAPPVLVRASELVAAIANLVVNALEAIAGDGTITVETGSDGGGFVEVADDGPGMTPEAVEHAFEPFYTTKVDGTGLGLATAYAFVHRHGGRVSLDTDADRGTRVRLWFPASSATASVRRDPDATQAVPRRLLVVEDDPASRDALALLLDEEGYWVETAASGEEALERFTRFSPDGMLVDFHLPGIDGASVARTARHQRPDLPVVVMSGDDTNEALAALLQEPHTARVGKPIDMDRLLAVLDHLCAPPHVDSIPPAKSPRAPV